MRGWVLGFGRRWTNLTSGRVARHRGCFLRLDGSAIDPAGGLEVVWTGRPPPHEPVDDHAQAGLRRVPEELVAAAGPRSRGGLKPIADGIRKMPPPSGHRSAKGQPRPNEAKRRRRSVVRLNHPTAELVPVSIDAGARGTSHRSGFRSAWTARHRWPPPHHQPHLTRPV